jgi:hypothetical protein
MSSRSAGCRKERFCAADDWARTRPDPAAGADAKAAPIRKGTRSWRARSVDFQGDDPERITDALKGAGAKAVRTK